MKGEVSLSLTHKLDENLSEDFLKDTPLLAIFWVSKGGVSLEVFETLYSSIRNKNYIKKKLTFSHFRRVVSLGGVSLRKSSDV